MLEFSHLYPVFPRKKVPHPNPPNPDLVLPDLNMPSGMGERHGRNSSRSGTTRYLRSLYPPADGMGLSLVFGPPAPFCRIETRLSPPYEPTVAARHRSRRRRATP